MAARLMADVIAAARGGAMIPVGAFYLEAHYGEEFVQHAQRTKRLIPMVC